MTAYRNRIQSQFAVPSGPPVAVWAALMLSAGLLLTAGGCGQPTAAEMLADSKPSGSAAVDRVVAAQPVRKTLQLYTTQPGRIEAFEETPLFPKVTGYVDEILVDIGDAVEKDQTLVKLWIPEMQDDLVQREALVAQAEAEVEQAQAAVEAGEAAVKTAAAKVAQAEAGVARAEAEYQRWRAEHDRIKELAAGGSVSNKLVDETLNQFRATDAARQEAAANVQSAEAVLNQSQANVHKAKADKIAAEARLRVSHANLTRTKTMLAYTEIRAPFDGVVTRRSVDTGHYVYPTTGGSGKPLLVVARTDWVRVFVDVPEMQAALVDAGENGDPAVVRVQSLRNREFKAPVTRTSWRLDDSNRSLRTQIDIRNTDGLLRPGMYASVSILLEQRDNVLTLPASAIVRDGDETFCCRVADGRIELQPIELGLRSGGEIEVVTGLHADWLVVQTGADSLRPEQPVEVIRLEK